LFVSCGFVGKTEAAPAERLQLLLAAPWYGSYVCNQGLTRLQLNLRALQENDPRQLAAEFVFSADPDNPAVPAGSFRMTGTLDNTGMLVLKQDRWLDQPADPSYRMVDLEGRLVVGDGQAMIRGRVTTYGCQDFAVWQYFSDAVANR
jgi:hypothetical protein